MILLGFFILLYPIIGDYLANRERSQAVASYSDVMEKIPDDKISMYLAAKITTNPLQTVVPLFLVFLIPILFFSMI